MNLNESMNEFTRGREKMKLKRNGKQGKESKKETWKEWINKHMKE